MHSRCDWRSNQNPAHATIRQRSVKHKSSPQATEHSPHSRLWQRGSKSEIWSSGSGRTDQGLLTWFWHLASRLASCVIWCAKNATGLFSSFQKWTTPRPKACKFTQTEDRSREKARVKAKPKAKAEKATMGNQLTEKAKARSLRSFNGYGSTILEKKSTTKRTMTFRITVSVWCLMV